MIALTGEYLFVVWSRETETYSLIGWWRDEDLAIKLLILMITDWFVWVVVYVLHMFKGVMVSINLCNILMLLFLLLLFIY